MGQHASRSIGEKRSINNELYTQQQQILNSLDNFMQKTNPVNTIYLQQSPTIQPSISQVPEIQPSITQLPEIQPPTSLPSTNPFLSDIEIPETVNNETQIFNNVVPTAPVSIQSRMQTSFQVMIQPKPEVPRSDNNTLSIAKLMSHTRNSKKNNILDRIKELIEREEREFVKDDLLYMLILLENGEGAASIIENSSVVTVPEIRQMIRLKMYGLLLNKFA